MSTPRCKIGAGSLPSEFYQSSLRLLTDRLLEVFREAQQLGSLPKSIQEALKNMSPKPEQVLTQLGSYRLLSIINMHLKVLAKALANRLKAVISHMIHD
ncbi:hypothetical protein NDU88_004254 [Pleurodeles waltl]|uniref:Uncharacterized protein n=1 Tax=Pleurodeles waltl TaxID=8319 RepID=A0AAV7L0Y1_PLEWA|nr:hypothetical protein NDU88_004254 [Pleurodeles waltl]